MKTAASPSEEPSKVRGVLTPACALIISTTCFSSGASLAKSLFWTIGPEGATTLRLIFGSIILALVFQPWKVRPDRNWRLLLPYGLSLGAMNLMFYMSLSSIPLGVAMAIEFVGPLTVAVMTSRQKIDYLWIALAGFGLLFLLYVGHPANRFHWRGIGFALGAGIGWAVYILSGQRVGRALGTSAAAAGTMIAAVAVAPIGLARAGSHMFHPLTLGIGMAVGLLSSALPYALEMIALRRLSASTYSTFVCAQPAIGSIIGFLILGENLQVIEWLGVGLIVIASVGCVSGAVGAIREVA